MTSHSERVYGPPARRAWVAELNCAGCGRLGGCENHHTANGGMGRKASYVTIVPLCQACHSELHTVGVKTFEARHGVDLKAKAKFVAGLWERGGGYDLGF